MCWTTTYVIILPTGFAKNYPSEMGGVKFNRQTPCYAIVLMLHSFCLVRLAKYFFERAPAKTFLNTLHFYFPDGPIAQPGDLFSFRKRKGREIEHSTLKPKAKKSNGQGRIPARCDSLNSNPLGPINIMENNLKKLNNLELSKREIEHYYILFSNLAKEFGEWKLKLDMDSLEYVYGFVDGVYKRVKKNKDFVLDLSSVGGKGKTSYIDFVIAGAGSFLAKLWLKKAEGKISFKKKFSGVDKATVIVTKQGGMFSPWIWVEKQILNGEEDSILTKFNYFIKLNQ